MLKRFLEHLSKLVGNPHAHRYLLAVSGGADSMVMSYLFKETALNFALAHCNFHLRGEDSNRDMQLVKELATQWDVEIFVKEFDTLALQKDSGKSIEMVARDLRYAWFEEIGKEFDYIVTAHQADDAAETLLLNICRGCGMRGFLSIPPQNGRIIRPMLPFSAQEIRDYARQHDIPFAIDCTNADETIKRNRLRASVIPILKELNPNLLDTLSRNREILRQQMAFYQNCMDKQKKAVLSERDGYNVIHVSILDSLEERELVLYEILSDFGFSADVATELCKYGKQSGTLFHSPTHTLLVNRDEYLIRADNPDKTIDFTLQSFEELKPYFSVELLHNEGNILFEKDNNILYLDEKDFKFPVTIRTWKTGDYFYPLGGSGKQKISDFFTDHKFDRFAKNRALLWEMNHDIVWIIGHRSDNRYKIDLKHTKNYYKIRYNGTL